MEYFFRTVVAVCYFAFMALIVCFGVGTEDHENDSRCENALKTIKHCIASEPPETAYQCAEIADEIYGAK